jgi:hypothetical protein
MKRHRAIVAALAVIGVALGAAPADGQPSPPPNDNYLASTIIPQAANTGMTEVTYTDAEDTTSATTQPDLFNPDKSGLPFGGGGPEPLTCNGATYGKTIWYDMHPVVNQGVELEAAGFSTVIAVYQWDVNTSKIMSEVGCQVSMTALDDYVLPQELQKGKAYTVQIGGVGSGSQAASGMLDLTANFFPDHDGDGIYDPLDACPFLPGVPKFAGCPPTIKPALSWSAVTTSGLQITKMVVNDIPGGARVEIRCSCGTRQVITSGPNANSVTATAFVGRTLPLGSTVEVWATKRASGRGQYKHGAIGGYLKFVASSSGLGLPTKRCLMPGSRTPKKVCPPGGRRPVGH